jgi:hypothetical protein
MPKDFSRGDARLRDALSLPNLFQPRVDRWPRGEALELAAKELLHGLSLKRRTRGQFVANFFGNVPDCDLNRHACIMPAQHALCKHRRRFGVALKLRRTTPVEKFRKYELQARVAS